MPEKFRQVAGGIYRGGKPSRADVRDLIMARGIKHIISLDKNIATEISPWIKEYGGEKFPHTVINLTASVNDRESVRYLRNNIRQLLTTLQPVYIHCRLGKDRTGLAIALYNVQARGWSCENALADARKMGFGTGMSPSALKMYTDAICPQETGEDPSEIDINEIHDDVVWLMRDWFEAGNVAPAFEPQQSFAPEFPVDFEQPYQPLIEREEGRAKREFVIQKLIDRLEGMRDLPKNVPIPGQYDNYGPPRGVGPVETGGGILF